MLIASSKRIGFSANLLKREFITMYQIASRRFELLNLWDVLWVHKTCCPFASKALISTFEDGLSGYSVSRSPQTIESLQRSRKRVLARSVPSWVKPSLRGMAAEAKFPGSQWISRRCKWISSKATLTRAAVDSVTRPRLTKSLWIQ